MHGSVNASANEFKNIHRIPFESTKYGIGFVYSKVVSYAINSAIKESCRIHTQKEHA